MTSRDVEVVIECDDVINVESDIVVMKNAEGADGAGKAVADAIGLSPYDVSSELPDVGGWEVFDTRGQIAARQALFLGVKPIPDFQYQDIRRFARQSLEIASKVAPDARDIAYTIHGPGYGLDEREAFESQLGGFSEAIKNGRTPDQLSQITIAERSPLRAEHLRDIQSDFLEGNVIQADTQQTEKVRSVGYDSEAKPRIFVATPLADDFKEVYHSGIKQAVDDLNREEDADVLCERIVDDSFTGSITEEISEKIESASLVVADMTNANPNVYLEVGYAWGSGTPTLQIVRDTDDLEFDVDSHNTLTYDRSRVFELRDELRETLEEIDPIEV
jgi:hypothetical protein